MSALAGRWNFDGNPEAGRDCKKMLRAQELYGPHHGASWDGGDIALGRRLFRILPEDVHDRGPLTGANGRVQLVADVRLDNREELAASLAIGAERARALPDAAFLLAVWERWGVDCFDRLLGDYAFALWDAAERRLVLARDPMGTRPLHYHLGRSFCAFASMPKGLHALADIAYAPDERRVAELIAVLPERGPASFFAGISRVEAGHFVTIHNGAVAARPHWNPSRESIAPWRGGDAAEALREQLDRAVAVRLRGGGGRVGAHLSGGLDSAAVAATAARLLAPEQGKVVAFTSVPREGYDGVVPRNRVGNEGPLAAATAALHANIEHVLVRPDQSGLLAGMDRDFHLLDRPLLNPCNQRWWNRINAEAQSRGIAVMLTGALGNMTISYAGWERLPELAAKGRWLRLLRLSRALVRAGEAGWPGVLGRTIGPWLPGGLWQRLVMWRSGQSLRLRDYSLIEPSLADSLDMPVLARERGVDPSYRPHRNGIDHRLSILRRFDQGNFNKAALGGWGVDMRDPTADRRLIEFCLSLPMHAFLDESGPKAVMRRAFADRLPERVLSERKKGLQAIDWHEALDAACGDLAEEVARLERLPAAATALDLPRMRALLDAWPAGGWNDPHISASYRAAFLRGVASGHFLRKASGSNA